MHSFRHQHADLGKPRAGSRCEVLSEAGVLDEMEASDITPRQTALNFRRTSLSREDDLSRCGARAAWLWCWMVVASCVRNQ